MERMRLPGLEESRYHSADACDDRAVGRSPQHELSCAIDLAADQRHFECLLQNACSR
jgi:hypothetical protein